MKRFFKATSLLLILFFSFIIGYFYTQQERLILGPELLDKSYVYEFDTPFEEINLSVGNGETINCIHFFHEKPKGVVLFLHGKGKNLSYWGGRAKRLVNYGYDVLVFDYRGFGKSSNNLTQENMMADSTAAYLYLKERYNEKDIVIHGVSLGTAMASYLNAHQKAKMCILVSPYRSMTEVAHYNKPILPPFVLKMILKFPLSTEQYVASARSDIHIFHGTHDKLIPYTHSIEIIKIAEEKNVNATLYPLDGFGHDRMDEQKEYKTKVSQLLNE
jgi:pimeloyl-ACP methyl ester carboxylesterase